MSATTAPDTFARLFVRADWMTDAACKGHDPNWWLPPRGGFHARSERAKKVCEGCPVAAQCLQHALDTGETSGIWGGVSIDNYRRGRTTNTGTRRAASSLPHLWEPIEHGTLSGYPKEKRRQLPHCDDCKAARAAHDRRKRAERRRRTA